MFIGIWRFVGQTIGQLNDQFSLILQNVQTQGVSRGFIPGRGRMVSIPILPVLTGTGNSLVVGLPDHPQFSRPHIA